MKAATFSEPKHLTIFDATQLDGMTELVERPSLILGDRGILTSQVRNLVESNQWLKNLYLSLPKQVLHIIRIGYGQKLWLAQCQDNVTEWDVSLWCWQPSLPVDSHYIVTMNANYHK